MSADPIPPGATVSILPSWRCPCLKCEVTSDWRCDCPAVDVPKITFNGECRISAAALHKKGCAPPPKCPNRTCRAEGWWIAPRWRHGEGTSRETMRRRKLERAAKRKKKN